MAAQVGFFLESFGVQTIGLGIISNQYAWYFRLHCRLCALQTLPKSHETDFYAYRNKTFYDLISQQL
jgi:hypothetical protein